MKHFRVHGKGTFVAQTKIPTRSPSYHGVREQLEQQGYSTRTETLAAEVIEADDRLARQLDVPLHTPLSMVERLGLKLLAVSSDPAQEASHVESV